MFVGVSFPEYRECRRFLQRFVRKPWPVHLAAECIMEYLNLSRGMRDPRLRDLLEIMPERYLCALGDTVDTVFRYILLGGWYDAAVDMYAFGFAENACRLFITEGSTQVHRCILPHIILQHYSIPYIFEWHDPCWLVDSYGIVGLNYFGKYALDWLGVDRMIEKLYIYGLKSYDDKLLCMLGYRDYRKILIKNREVDYKWLFKHRPGEEFLQTRIVATVGIMSMGLSMQSTVETVELMDNVMPLVLWAAVVLSGR